MIHADCKGRAPWTMRRCLNKKIIKEEKIYAKIKKTRQYNIINTDGSKHVHCGTHHGERGIRVL